MTCPNRACRRADEHDAKGCVVAAEVPKCAPRISEAARERRRPLPVHVLMGTLVPGAVDGTVADVGTPVAGPLTVAAGTAYFMSRRLKP